ncbi:amphi-Trp domain-containing protein [Candidatus Bipolaricaulota bacterium]|nr:amphi-Trp domain-containing protein [Candidatus Bipolaricaulota bacterium]
MVELPSSSDELGAEFEYDQNVTKQDLISFLEELLGQLKNDDAVTVSMVGTEATFPFEEPINLEIETDYNKKLGKRELEIEIEFREDETRT